MKELHRAHPTAQPDHPSSASRVHFLVQWQSLVVPVYRSVWRELGLQSGWSITMVAPDQFREGGMQDLTCARNDPKNPPLITLPVKRLHTQAVWFNGLAAVLKSWIKTPGERKIFLCFAEPYSLTALFSVLALLQARVVTAFSGPRPRLMFYGFQNIYKKFPVPIRLTQSLLFALADAILVAGSEHESVLRAHGFKGRCIRLPMWFDPSIFHLGTITQNVSANVSPNSGQMTTDRQKIKIGYAGSLLPEKGIAQILDALIDNLTRNLTRNLTENLGEAHATAQPLNSASLLDCAFEIAGDGILRSQIVEKTRSLSSLGLNAVYRGPIASTEMANFYRSIDILVVPSLTAPHWKEQFGRVIIEAMACGCVIIGSDSGEIPSVIGDAQWIFPEANRQEFLRVLSRAIQFVTRDSAAARKKMSADALRRFGDQAIAKDLMVALTLCP